MRAFIAKELNVSVENVHAFVLGGHGDTMVPLPRYSTVAGIPITDLMDKATIDRISARTAGGGLEITQLVGTSAWYAPGASVVEMVEAILLDKKKILPCSVFLQGEYGVRDLFVGVPCKLGARGLEKIIEIKLTPGRRRGVQEVGRGGQGTRRCHRRVAARSWDWGLLLGDGLDAGERGLLDLTARASLDLCTARGRPWLSQNAMIVLPPSPQSHPPPSPRAPVPSHDSRRPQGTLRPLAAYNAYNEVRRRLPR